MRKKKYRHKAKSVMRGNTSSYSQTRNDRMNKTFNMKANSVMSRPRSRITSKGRKIRKVPSLDPVRGDTLYQKNEDEILQNLNTKSNRARRTRNYTITNNSSMASGGRTSGSQFYTPKGGINFPLTYYSEAAQKSQKISRKMRTKHSKRLITTGYHHSSTNIIQEEGAESVTTTCKKKKIRQKSALKSKKSRNSSLKVSKKGLKMSQKSQKSQNKSKKDSVINFDDFDNYEF